MKKLYITAEADRLTVASILIKNKYRVRAGSQRRPGTKSYNYFLECELVPDKPFENRLYIEDEADQLRKNVKRYYYLEYDRNPEPEKKVEA